MDKIEQLGIEKAKKSAKEADGIILVLDITEIDVYEENNKFVFDLSKDYSFATQPLVLLNKTDLMDTSLKNKKIYLKSC